MIHAMFLYFSHIIFMEDFLESSQHSRSQARAKEEGCVRFGEPVEKSATLMEMKHIRNSLGRNPLSDALHRNLGVVLNEQGPGRHPSKGASYRDMGTMKSEQGSGRRSLSGALHLRPGVVKNEQGSSHFPRRVRRVRKLAESTRLRISSWNVGSLTGRL